MTKKILISTALLFISILAVSRYPDNFAKPLRRIAFGSCNIQSKNPQPLWETILTNKPDLWIWLGDNIYADTRDPKVMRKKYIQQFFQNEYAQFRISTPIIGTWDDHDYGENDAGRSYPMKAMSQQKLLNFLEEPRESARRKQKGVYTSYDFGPEDKKVKVILLDTRYFADKKKYSDILGEAQWKWLENEFKTNSAKINILVSSIQVINEDQPYEKWSKFPKSKKRLFDLIKSTGIQGLVMISGDRHFHEISVMNNENTPYILTEATSSGLTHYYKGLKKEKNKYRSGKLHKGLGFGLIDINWRWERPWVSLQIRDSENNIVNQQVLFLNQLVPSKVYLDKK